MNHTITRHRHELTRRTLTVKEKTQLTPGMLRILFEGDGLGDFVSLSPDDHIKLFIPMPAGEIERRDYTPRRFDTAARLLEIDFAIHEAGPATQWAISAAPGDRLDIGGPRGSLVVPASFDWWLLIGDETALPAIGRRIEELPAGTPVTSIVAVAGKEEEQSFSTCARHTPIWVHRPGSQADDPEPVLAALRKLSLPPGEGYVWIASEARVMRAARDHFRALGHPTDWMRASGYWLKGVADAHDKLEH